MAIFFRNNLNVAIAPDTSNVEAVWCKLSFCRRNYLIGAFYRPPSSVTPVLLELNESLLCYVARETNLNLGGEFNLPYIDWGNYN